jgi:23S rRNA (cytosine1962-C5)-methyltransferase
MKTAHSTFAEIKNACQHRRDLAEVTNAYQLYNGFYEGYSGLVFDRFAETLVVFDHNIPGEAKDVIDLFSQWAISDLEGIKAILLKQRQSPEKAWIKGKFIAGEGISQTIQEYGIFYALDLQLNQDAGFYLDTRNLRRWLLDHSAGLDVLNTFAYTGSLGIAAGMGGASKVIQTDLNSNFLNIARQSWKLNHLDSGKHTNLSGDFFRVTGKLRHAGRLFGIVILDPPFFSTTEAGRVDLQEDVSRLINKVRPLVAHEGWLVVINNALFLSGMDFMAQLNTLCQSPYLSLERIIPVPEDVTGYPETILDPPPVNPAPFNHPTKIAILRVYRKDRQK